VTLEPRGPRALLETESYLRQAAELTLKRMTGEKDAQAQVKVVGAPVTLPESLRRTSLEPRRFPDAYVLTTTYVKGKFREPALVWFADGVADIRFSYPTRPDAFLPLEEREWTDVSSRLSGFYAVATDVTRGPERFDAYLPADMRQMLDLRGEKNRMWLRPDAIEALSNEQLRRFVSLMFDRAVLNVWIEVSGRPAPSNDVRPADIRRDAVAAIASLEASTAAMRKTLADAGAVVPERMAAVSMYIRRLLGEGYMVREDPARDGIKLPRGARMYTVLLGGPLPHVIVDKGKVRVVAVDFF
jgi:hypothetical protein